MPLPTKIELNENFGPIKKRSKGKQFESKPETWRKKEIHLSSIGLSLLLLLCVHKWLVLMLKKQGVVNLLCEKNILDYYQLVFLLLSERKRICSFGNIIVSYFADWMNVCSIILLRAFMLLCLNWHMSIWSSIFQDCWSPCLFHKHDWYSCAVFLPSFTLRIEDHMLYKISVKHTTN